jgi:hypothetical protein
MGAGVAVVAAVSVFAVLPSSAPNSQALAGVLDHEQLHLRYPSSWEPLPASRLGSFGLSSQVALSPRREQGEMQVGAASRVGVALLPASLESALSPTARAEFVRLGNREYVRYRRGALTGSLADASVYAAPTSHGAIVAVCAGPDGRAAVAPDCERMLATARIDGASAADPRPSTSFARTLAAIIGRLDAARRAQEGRLRSAKSPESQAAAAATLATAHANALASLRRSVPGRPEESVRNELIAALKATANGYHEMATGARRSSSQSYNAGRALAQRAELQLRAALRQMGELQTWLTGRAR